MTRLPHSAHGLWIGLSANLRGAVWQFSSSLTFAVMNGLVKMMGAQLHPFELAFFRCLFGLLGLLPFLIGPGRITLRTNRPILYFLRCAIGVSAMLAIFYGLTSLPLATAVSISFTRPLFMLVLAALFLGERLEWKRGLATALGFLGVVILLRPTADGADSETWLLGATAAIFAAFAMAVVLILIKKLSETEHPVTLLFWFTLASTIGTAGPAAATWHTPDGHQMLWLLAIGLLANVGQFFMFRAYQVGEASVVGPVDYTQLLWVGLIGQIFFAEIPSPTLLAGATLIVLSTFYILRQGIKAAAKPPPDAS